MMDKQKKMLISAAKAIGIAHDGAGFVSESGLPINWNPYESGADLLALARKLKFRVDWENCSVLCKTFYCPLLRWGDDYSLPKTDAEAIVALAAMIGDAMDD